MPIVIRFLEHPPLRGQNENSRSYDGTVDFDKLGIGDLCFYHHRGVACCNHAHLQILHLTAYYFANNFPKRPPLILAMPDAASKSPRYFLVDGQCYSSQCTKCGQTKRQCKCGDAYQPRGYYDGWTVNGAPPLISVSPSVNFDDDEAGSKHYHGYITNGVIGDG